MSKKRKYIRKWVKGLIIVIGVLVILRIILPYVVLHYANKTLAEMEGYFGHINDIDIALYRGAYQINSIYLDKIDSVSGKSTPFFKSDVIDLSVEWNALFEGRLVGELEFLSPSLFFVKEKVEPEQLQADTSDFRELLDDFMPLKVNRFEVHHGEIHFLDSTTKPKVDLIMTNTYILAKNLSSVVDTSAKGLPSSVEATASIYGGSLAFNMRLDPLSKQTEFDLNAQVENVQLTKVNDFFDAYANIDVNKGTFGMYTELAASDGKFVGYVKPILKELDIVGKEDAKDSFFRQLWEIGVASTAVIFSNWKEGQLATRIPLEGKVNDLNANIWVTIFEMLRNAFVQALQPSIDNKINIATVNNPKEEKKNFIQKIFGGNDDPKDEDMKKDEKKNIK